MNKYTTLSLIFLFLTVTGVNAAPLQQGGQPNPLACDLMSNNLIPVIETRQQEYFIYYGSFFQGLPTHSTAPTGDTVPDGIAGHPTDQPLTWLDFLGDDMPDEMPCRYTINVYDGPTGRGYDLIIEYTDTSRRATDTRNMVCDRIEARGANARGRGKSWSCLEK